MHDSVLLQEVLILLQGNLIWTPLRQSACLAVNPIMVYSYGFLFNCTTVGQAQTQSCAEPGFFFFWGGGGGGWVSRPYDQKQYGQCFLFCFILDLNLFYSFKMGSNGFITQKTFFSKDAREGPTFSRGGPTFLRGGGSKC